MGITSESRPDAWAGFFVDYLFLTSFHFPLSTFLLPLSSFIIKDIHVNTVEGEHEATLLQHLIDRFVEVEIDLPVVGTLTP